jgi:site-specific recombinase XerD
MFLLYLPAFIIKMEERSMNENKFNSVMASFFNDFIRLIPLKKAEKKNIRYLTIDGMKLLLQQPDRTSRQGRRDLALLALMYDTGARVQEITDLTVENVRCTKPYTVRITGKGQKTRIVPLLDDQVVHLLKYMKENRLEYIENSCKPLFLNNRMEKLTRGGITYILQKYIEMAKSVNPGLIPDGITCHSLRHSKAMHLLQTDVSLIYIRDILGHESVMTTEIYAKTDSKRKREVLTNAFTPTIEEQECDRPLWLKDDNLLEWLKGL